MYVVALINLGDACLQNSCYVQILLSALATAVDAICKAPWLQLVNVISLITLKLEVLLYCLLLKSQESQAPDSDL